MSKYKFAPDKEETDAPQEDAPTPKKQDFSFPDPKEDEAEVDPAPEKELGEEDTSQEADAPKHKHSFDKE